jgi:hypothetical protein
VPLFDRDELAAAQKRFDRFHAWERTDRDELTPQEALAAVSAHRMLSPEAHQHNPDPACTGFRRLLDTLSLLRG